MTSAVGAVSLADGTLSAKCGADLSALQHTFVKLTDDFEVQGATAGTDAIIGILQNKPAWHATDVARRGIALVKIMGGSKLVASGVIAIGARITATTGGKGIATTTDGDHVGAVALEAAAADTELISVFVTNERQYIA